MKMTQAQHDDLIKAMNELKDEVRSLREHIMRHENCACVGSPTKNNHALFIYDFADLHGQAISAERQLEIWKNKHNGTYSLILDMTKFTVWTKGMLAPASLSEQQARLLKGMLLRLFDGDYYERVRWYLHSNAKGLENLVARLASGIRSKLKLKKNTIILKRQRGIYFFDPECSFCIFDFVNDS